LFNYTPTTFFYICFVVGCLICVYETVLYACPDWGGGSTYSRRPCTELIRTLAASLGVGEASAAARLAAWLN
ncbi:hypothetical protein, partial [Streptomyces sp. NPDC058424]|uniref:hypothetical protein n=1 Tax=Streptomyces sp. NPDC058424 TaxID=3346491 RepID=UPI00366A1151